MGAEAGVDDELSSVVGFGKFEQKDSLQTASISPMSISGEAIEAYRGQVVDVGHAEVDELRGQFLSDDLFAESQSLTALVCGQLVRTWTSNDENLCFIVCHWWLRKGKRKFRGA